MIRFGFWASFARRFAVISTATPLITLSRCESLSPSFRPSEPSALLKADSALPTLPFALRMITRIFLLPLRLASFQSPGATNVELATPSPWTPPARLSFFPLPLPLPPPASAAMGAVRTNAAQSATIPPRPPRPHRALERCSPPRVEVPHSALWRTSLEPRFSVANFLSVLSAVPQSGSRPSRSRAESRFERGGSPPPSGGGPESSLVRVTSRAARTQLVQTTYA